MPSMAEVLYIWAGGSLAASAGYVLGRAQGIELGRDEEQRRQAKREVDNYFMSLPHGNPSHWCTEECYQHLRRWKK